MMISPVSTFITSSGIFSPSRMLLSASVNSSVRSESFCLWLFLDALDLAAALRRSQLLRVTSLWASR